MSDKTGVCKQVRPQTPFVFKIKLDYPPINFGADAIASASFAESLPPA